MAVNCKAPAGGRTASSLKFGLLLAHFFMGDREALTVRGAARLSGLKPAAASALLELLAEEGLLSRCGGRGGRAFRADTVSGRYRRCLRAYRGQRGLN
jgi:Fic family protein